MSQLPPADPLTARLEQPDQTKPPVLTSGTVTPQVLRDWEDGCNNYFFHKSITDDRQVRAIVLGLKDHRIGDWYRSAQAVIVAMPFDDFVTAVQNKLLKDGWQHNLQKEILSSAQGKLPFDEWQNSLGASNSLLVGSTYHVTEAGLRNHINANMHDELSHECFDANAQQIATYKGWIDTVVILDTRRLRDLEKQKCLLDDTMKLERARNSKVLSTSSRGNKHIVPSNTSSSTSVPKLTDTDCTLLNQHEGCYKCHRFYVNHKGNACPNGFPEATLYKGLTEADALIAKKKKNVIAVVNLALVSPTLVKPTVVAAVGMSSSVIGNGMDSESYVPPPLHAPHLYWDCLADVMIKPDLADMLGLRQVALPEPEEFTLAMDSGEVKTFGLQEMVDLKLYSVGWALKTVHAFVAPGLCTSLILGQSFLATHKIVIDYELRTVTDKRSGFDLLGPQPVFSKPPPTRLQTRRNLPKPGTIRHQKLAVIKELKSTALPYLRSIVDRLSPKPTAAKCFLAAVRVRMEQLASAATLNKLDVEFKEHFADRFSELPHTDNLPKDIYHRVKLKDANQIVACKGYGCPRKYKEAWGILIQQHLDAGQIRPSNSPYASPAFHRT
ncbi:hypothetical protein PILCRDRAFT_7047 [Piloderma croceum F 1598]|uniref:Uncharacterized protein n=1 Tax=Piloderma croceum (strain F 1598) TaxID=765440 RepID=A0A0C3BBI2_PILCF|nr:hypothetical protein PILCRDRAFT_7047 [Piloderma croceum F 1598]